MNNLGAIERPHHARNLTLTTRHLSCVFGVPSGHCQPRTECPRRDWHLDERKPLIWYGACYGRCDRVIHLGRLDSLRAIGSFGYLRLSTFSDQDFRRLYLLWLAYKSFKSAASRHDIEAKELAGGRRTPFGYFKRGYIVQMTNPKAALAWIAIISIGLQADAPLWVGAAIVIGTFAMSIAVHALYAVAFSTPAMVRLYGKSRRAIQGVLGTFFALAGLRLLTSRS